MNIIKTEDLGFCYTTHHNALKNICMEIKEKEFVCIIGENGSRKKYIT